MYVLETFTQSVNCLYALANGFPFSTYGENVFLGLPNLVILWVFARSVRGVRAAWCLGAAAAT